ncbi:YbaN family protein [Nitratireductor aquimarinus]|uniref:YbaN family protein n=1 Tax=Nitratireductor aquimarinus TaxID=889300 RepID=A0ABU4AMG1_9HYPH|nr:MULTISPECIES: YbaN family protein [Nitratireductor]MBN7760374.1 YbaN family protein [Nitratireductor aquibiodomus]MCV0378795.1 YbaN family protein [Nitratireductor sp.]MDV2965597.1 YbaN family protein [Nitratireductor aquimarinus]MDV6227435.1 YbaN family protein [Nitratireductor aquimarinus]
MEVERSADLPVDGDRSLRIAPAFENAKRAILLVLGLVMLLLAVIGAFLPVMPTTIFLILAAWFFARSSPRLERRLMEHPSYGPVLRGWRDHGIVPRRAKLFAVTGISCGYVISLFAYQPGLPLAIALAVAMAAIAVWIVSRPEG